MSANPRVMLLGKGGGSRSVVPQRLAAECSDPVDARRAACSGAWKTADDVAGVMKYSKLPLRHRIGKFNGHICVGKCVE
jgi:hypothetical protein